jgi:hypothetical protein
MFWDLRSKPNCFYDLNHNWLKLFSNTFMTYYFKLVFIKDIYDFNLNFITIFNLIFWYINKRLFITIHYTMIKRLINQNFLLIFFWNWNFFCILKWKQKNDHNIHVNIWYIFYGTNRAFEPFHLKTSCNLNYKLNNNKKFIEKILNKFWNKIFIRK